MYVSFNRLFPFAVALLLALASCSNNKSNNLPNNFNSLSNEDKMEFLMQEMPADSVANFICNIAMGKVHNARIELNPALQQAYEKYNEADLVKFQMALAQYQQVLPLHEQIRLTKLIGMEDIDQYSYDLGLSYVGTIRSEQKDIKTISEELKKLQKECKSDPEFYVRFMKGFKTALNYDRHHDLDDNIYLTFISYPDSINLK